jgi:hypothetical protein
MATTVPALRSRGEPTSACGAVRPSRRLLAVLVTSILITSVLVAYQGKSSAAPLSHSSAVTATVAAASNPSSNGVEPGTCPTHNTESFAKTKFVLHSGLAFGAFHRWIYKPFRSGGFSSSNHKRVLAFVKAAAAGAFVVHEVRQAAQAAQANPTLCKAIAAPLRSFYDSVKDIASRIKHGDTSGITEAQQSLSSASTVSSSHGIPIKENQNAPI